MLRSDTVRVLWWPILLIVISLAAVHTLTRSSVAVAQRSEKEPGPAAAKQMGTTRLSQELIEIRQEVEKVSRRVALLIERLDAPPKAAPPTEDTAESTPEETLHREPYPTDELRTEWKLSLLGVLAVGLQQSSVTSKLGVVATCSDKEGSIRLARVNSDVSVSELRSRIRNWVWEVEETYWDIWHAFELLTTVKQFREHSQTLWNQVSALPPGAQRDLDEAQAREQYFFARAQVQDSLGELFDKQNRLQFLLGLSRFDSRMIRPSDTPDLAPTMSQPARTYLATIPELIQQREKIKHLEADLRPEEEPTRSQRFARLNVARETARLEEMELNAIHLLTNSMRLTDNNWSHVQVHFNRWQAASEETNALGKSYQQGKHSFDRVADAHRRFTQASSDFSLAQAELAKTKSELLFRQGKLLERRGIEISDELLVQQGARR